MGERQRLTQSGEREKESAEWQLLLIGIGFNKCWPINVIEVLKNSRDGAYLVFHSNLVRLVIRLSASPRRMIIVQAPTFKNMIPINCEDDWERRDRLGEKWL